MSKSFAAAFLFLTLLLAAGACEEEPVAPKEVVTEYVLDAVNGEPPPQVIFENETGQLIMVEGQMAFFDNDTYIQQINFEQVMTGGETIVQTSRICEGTFDAEDAHLILTEEDCDDRVYEATTTAETLSYLFSEGVEVTWRVDADS